MSANEYLQSLLKKIPHSPGVYLMKNSFGDIIYVGKALSLKKRVRQYFNKNIKDLKVLAMVSNIDDIEYIVTDNEMEALMLENNLIKKNKPFYNILLRDDKSFPYIKVTQEEYPKIYKTRNKLDKDGLFFGPYTDVLLVNKYLQDIQKFFRLRDCSRNIERSIATGERPCLNYHIGICSAPCAAKISKEEYNQDVASAIEFLKGNHDRVKALYEQKIQEAVQELRFEDAAEFRDRMLNLNRMREKQNVSIKKYRNTQHFISYASNEDRMVFTVLVYEDGNLVGREYYDFDRQVGDFADVLSSFIMQYYTDNANLPKELYLEENGLDISALNVALNDSNERKMIIHVAKIGKKKDILLLAKKNSQEQLTFLEIKKQRKESLAQNALLELEDLTGISPIHTIESYDISNIGGADSVGVKVVFKEGKKSPSDYRKYRIQSQGKPDDYASTAEVIERRLKREDFPDIILLDGGKGHVSTIKKVLIKNGVDIPVFGMFKNDKHQTEGLTDEYKMYPINKKSKLFRLLTEIQNEVHRFAINYHRRTREKSMIRSELDEIPGVGEKRKLLLLKTFGSVQQISQKTVEELSQPDGMNRKVAQQIVDFFKKKE